MTATLRRVKGEYVLRHETGREIARSHSEALLRGYAADSGITIEQKARAA